MKKLSVITKSIFLGSSLAVMLVLSSCAQKMNFVSSSVVPAAEGSVKIRKDNNKNHTLQVSVAHLAPSDQLSPPQNTYVVWMVSERNGTHNIGQLKSSGGLFSKTLKASLKTITPFNPTSFFITSEPNGNVDYPGYPIILSTQ